MSYQFSELFIWVTQVNAKRNGQLADNVLNSIFVSGTPSSQSFILRQHNYYELLF